jgi:hypothetical protein
MSRDLICVYRTVSVEEADIIVAWLAEEKINSFVKNRHAIGTGYLALAAAPRGVEVCVFNPDQAERAKALLVEHADESAVKKLHDAAGPDIEAVCVECGRTSRFPFAQRGSVQTCPHCRQYLDVPQA